MSQIQIVRHILPLGQQGQEGNFPECELADLGRFWLKSVPFFFPPEKQPDEEGFDDMEFFSFSLLGFCMSSIRECTASVVVLDWPPIFRSICFPFPLNLLHTPKITDQYDSSSLSTSIQLKVSQRDQHKPAQHQNNLVSHSMFMWIKLKWKIIFFVMVTTTRTDGEKVLSVRKPHSSSHNTNFGRALILNKDPSQTHMSTKNQNGCPTGLVWSIQSVWVVLIKLINF